MIIRPSRIMPTRSHSASTSLSTWDEKSTVAPGVPALAHELVERLLHDRVEALGRLVEHEQLGVVLDGLDDAELLAHPARVLAHRSGEIGPRQLEQLERSARDPGSGHRRAPRGDRAGRRRACGRRTAGRSAGSRSGRAPRRRRSTGRDRAPGPIRRRGAAARARSGSPSSCRRRSVRGSRTPRPARP